MRKSCEICSASALSTPKRSKSCSALLMPSLRSRCHSSISIPFAYPRLARRGASGRLPYSAGHDRGIYHAVNQFLVNRHYRRRRATEGHAFVGDEVVRRQPDPARHPPHVACLEVVPIDHSPLGVLEAL